MKTVKAIVIALLMSASASIVNTQEIIDSAHPQNTRSAVNEKLKDPAENYLATYFGGSGEEGCWTIALDDEENVYIAGYTRSNDFPVTQGSYKGAPKGKADVFVIKFDRDLRTVLASTRIGGDEDELAHSIIYDKKGYIYVVGALSNSFSQQSDFPKLTGPYLGQKPPGMTPEIFAPGIISTELHDDAAPVFSPDGNEVYFRIVYKIEETNYGTIFMMRQENGVWSSPKVAPFSGQYMDGSVTFSKDFQKLYFGSTRSDGDKLSGDMDLWEVNRVGSGWGKPSRLRELNSEGNESYPSESSDRALYWTVEAERNDPKPEIFRSRRIDGKWTKRERVNFLSDSDSARNFVFAPDGSFILFTMWTPDHDVDMFAGFKRDDGSWGDPINLGPAVNSSHMDKCPSLSPDGKFLFFVSSRPNGNKNPQKVWHSPFFKNSNFSADVYWVSSKIIDELRPKESKNNR